MDKPKLSELERSRLEGILGEIRASAAARFFADPGLPEEMQKNLAEGWAVLEERRRERAKAGVPLPPGGCVVMGLSAVYAQCMADFHSRLAGALDVPPSCIKLRREKARWSGDSDHVVADVALPEGWPTECDDAHRMKVWATCAMYGQCPDDQMAQVLRGYEAGEIKLHEKLITLYLSGLVDALNSMWRRELAERLAAVQTVRAELVPFDENGESWAPSERARSRR